MLPPWALKWAVPAAGYLLAAIFGWRLLSAHERIGELEAERESQAAETREAAIANETNVAAIASLTSAIDTMVEERRAEAARTEAELQARERALMVASEEADRLREERNALIRDDPKCAVHGAQVLADSCPDIAQRLLERSRGPGRNPH